EQHRQTHRAQPAEERRTHLQAAERLTLALDHVVPGVEPVLVVGARRRATPVVDTVTVVIGPIGAASSPGPVRVTIGGVAHGAVPPSSAAAQRARVWIRSRSTQTPPPAGRNRSRAAV